MLVNASYLELNLNLERPATRTRTAQAGRWTRLRAGRPYDRPAIKTHQRASVSQGRATARLPLLFCGGVLKFNFAETEREAFAYAFSLVLRTAAGDFIEFSLAQLTIQKLAVLDRVKIAHGAFLSQ